MEPKDKIEEGIPPLDLEDDDFIYPENDCDDCYYADSEDFAIDDLYPKDDPEMDYYDSLDDDLDPNPHWDMPFDDDEDDIFDDLEGLDESDLY